MKTKQSKIRKGRKRRTETDVYRMLSYKIIEEERLINALDLFSRVIESKKTRKDLLFQFFLHNLIKDPDPPIKIFIFPLKGELYVGLQEDAGKIMEILG